MSDVEDSNRLSQFQEEPSYMATTGKKCDVLFELD